MSIAFVNGCFDLFSPHHARFLNRAAQYGEHLVVGLNSDESVRKLKGQSRPFYKQDDRKLILESMRVVSEVRVFDTEDELSEMIRQLRPVMVKGEEYRRKSVTGAEYARSVVFLDGSFVGGITETILHKLMQMAYTKHWMETE